MRKKNIRKKEIPACRQAGLHLIRALAMTGLLVMLFASPCFAISLDESKVVGLASKSLSAQQLDAQAEAAATDRQAARSLYDTNLGIEGWYERDDSAKASAIMGGRTDNVYAALKLGQHLPSGTDLSFAFINQRTQDYSTLAIGGVPVFPTSAYYEPIIALELRQPIAKNVFGYTDRRSIKQADHASMAAELNAYRSKQEVIYRTLASYWTAVLMKKHIRALKYQLKSSRNFLRITTEKHKIGTADEADLMAAKASVYSSEAEIEAAQASIQNSEYRLRQLLDVPPDEKLNLKDEKLTLENGGGISSLIKKALETRPDFIASKNVFEQRKFALQSEKNKRWPSLDIVASLQLNNIDTNYGNALKDTDNPKFRVGLEFSIPLQNKSARAAASKAKYEKAQALYSFKQLENSIANEVARSNFEHHKRWQQVSKLNQLTYAQKKKLKVEMNKYARQGRSSAAVISKYEQDLASAQLRLVAAQINYEQARLDLLLATSAWETGE